MFNLFVRWDRGAWDEGNVFEYEGTRALKEYTDEILYVEHGSFNPGAIAKLISYPCLFVYEKDQSGTPPAKVGRLIGIKKAGTKVSFAYHIDPLFPSIPLEKLEELSWDLDIDKFEFHRTHWSLKNVDLHHVLFNAGLVKWNENIENLDGQSPAKNGSSITLEALVKPTVFRIPASPVEDDLVSIMMPFDQEFRPVYDAIKNQCSEFGLRCIRADSVWEETEVFQDIFSLIYRSKIVICDYTGRNSNVFYEAGIAHTLGRSVIPITQSRDDVPFDLRHHRYVLYLNNNEGLATLKNDISPRLLSLTRR